MTWEEQLFSLLDDLEQQAEALYDSERDLELADRSRAEYAHVSLASRLMASLDDEVGLEVGGVGLVHGVLQRVGDGWCLVRGSGQDWVLRTDVVTLVRGASERSVPEIAWSPVARLGLGSALRRIADTRDPCVVHRIDGRRHDVVLTRVGEDFVEAVGSDAKLLLFPFASLAAVQSRD
jgi:hypothetical protein